jgi:hypothetical protein
MKKQNNRSAVDLFNVNIKVKEKLPGIKIRGQKIGFYDPEDFQFQGGNHRKDN